MAVPDDQRLRDELPAYLARQRRGTMLGLALILPVCAALDRRLVERAARPAPPDRRV